MIKPACSTGLKSSFTFNPEENSSLATAEAVRPLCRCLRIMKEQVEASCAKDSNETLHDVIRDSKAGSGCNSCHSAIREILRAQKEKADQKELTCASL